MTVPKKLKSVLTGRTALLCLLDAVLIALSMGGALWLRMDFRFSQIDPIYLETIRTYYPVNLVCTLLLFLGFKVYSRLWQFAGMREVAGIILPVGLSGVLQYVGMKLLGLAIPRSFAFLYMMLLLIALVGTHVLVPRLIHYRSMGFGKQTGVPTLIIGAGTAGGMLIREIQTNEYVGRVVRCILDDDKNKIGSYLRGVPVVGTTEELLYYVKKYDIMEIIVAIPSLEAGAKKRLLELCQESARKTMTLPGIYQIVNGDVSVSMLREVDINDLLGRPPVQLEMEEIMDYVSGKVILVTGGGGSIGSEICRQLALHRPKLLIILDIYENNAYDIRNELLKTYPDLNLEVLIGSVRNKKRIDTIFETYHPSLVFHAAAHKHVPLMEDSPNESIKNNVLGTWNVADAADRYGTDRMVLISTDKAVRPTSIMGASKRICELIIQCYAQRSRTEYAAVRFGNVLGSNGSVVPLFRRQIAAGGPVTVTHPDIIRYFMTIPEAVNLVLQCGALAHGGEIFILDMGDPVKIDDLARKMIRLSGLEPDVDIEIRYVGLRPGEKLYEELLISLDNLKETPNKRIFVAQQDVVNADRILEQIQALVDSAFDEADDIRAQVQQLVPEYTPRPNRPGDAEQTVPAKAPASVS